VTTLSNVEVASRLGEIADLLDLLGERFKPEAYRRAARSIEALPEALSAYVQRGELRTIPGVGEAIADKATELLATGSLAYLERLRGEVPPGVLALMRLPGVGPKTARRFWAELAIAGPAELRAAIDAGRLTGVKGFAEKKIGQLRSAVDATVAAGPAGRLPLEEVWPVARTIVRALRQVPSVHAVEVAGSFRRARETVGDLDILVTADAPDRVFDVFTALPVVGEVRLRGPTKETVVLRRGLQVDLRVVEPEAFGAALQYFTGSKDHNVRLRSLARDLGLKVNEYGVYRGEARVAGRTEEEVYAALGLAWIPPELREGRGEIAAAARGPLPRLVDAQDLRTEPHLHLAPEPDPVELDRWAVAARSRGLSALGVVVAVVHDGRPRWSAPAEVLAALARGSPAVEMHRVVELTGRLDPASVREAAALGAGYVVLAPSPGAEAFEPPDPPAVPVALVAHVGGTAQSSRPWLELAHRCGAAIEVGPGPERCDSTVARTALELGIRLSLPTGLGEPDDGSTGPVALGFARRAGAVAASVLNAQGAQASSAPPEPPSTARPARPGRRRR
jgi:DNA polymerase (family X)